MKKTTTEIITEITPVLSADSIDSDCVREIRDYLKNIDRLNPWAAEAKLQREAINALAAGDPLPKEYSEYNTHVVEIVGRGKLRKAEITEKPIKEEEPIEEVRK